MPTYKNESKKANKWYCKFYYTDYKGDNKQKKKEGFATKKAADEWEREFLSTVVYSPEIPFKVLYQHYIEDMKHRNREHTITNTAYVVTSKVLPFFLKTFPLRILPH